MEAMLEAWRAGGLGVAGAGTRPAGARDGTGRRAADRRKAGQLRSKTGADPQELAGTLVAKAQQNSARIRFIENPELLSEVGGVGALLRFKI